MRRLVYISAQPRTLYYAWQVETFIHNFMKSGINPNNIEVLVAYNSDPNHATNSAENLAAFKRLAEVYNYVRFFFYEDKRKSSNYISSIRPNVLKQHFKKFPELSKEAIFYHDSDIVFTRSPNFNHLLEDDVWYLSDTISYIGADYILSKGEDIYKKMCEIVNIRQKTPRLNQKNSGGAQYIMKNIDSKFWAKVEKDSEDLFTIISEISNQKLIAERHTVLPDGPTRIPYHPIQIWCADMWAVLWNAWYYKHQTKVEPYMDFCWPTQPIQEWNKKVICHNAGVTEPGNMFYKASYMNRLPFDTDNTFDKTLCSSKYFEEVSAIKDITCLK